jgi:hypothetical protein
MSGVVTILGQIATIEREIIVPTSGSAPYAYDNIPHTINMGMMPCFVNFPGPLISNILDGSDQDGREFYEIRNFNLAFYLAPLGAGINEEMAGDLAPYFELVYTKFGQYPRLKASPEIVDAVITGDSGTTQLAFIQTTYYGIRFTLKVTRLVRRILSNSD